MARFKDVTLGPAQTTATSQSAGFAKPFVHRTSGSKSTAISQLLHVVRRHKAGTEEEKLLIALYTCLAFTIARKYTEGRTKVDADDMYSPFWTRKPVQITPFAYEMLDQPLPDDPNVEGYPEPEDVEYDEESEAYRRICDASFLIVLRWLRRQKKGSIRAFVTALLSRKGAIRLKKIDMTGSTLGFALIRPIVGRYFDEMKFQKQRQMHFNARQGTMAVVQQIVDVAAKAAKLDGDVGGKLVGGLLEISTNLIAGESDANRDMPLFNDMRMFIIRSRDIIQMLSTMADEIVRQQRANELDLRKRKQQLRERFDRPEIAMEQKELRSEPQVAADNLLHEILDVSANVAIGYYLVNKVYREFTNSKVIEAKGEDITGEGLLRERPGEAALVTEMLDVMYSGTAGATLASSFSIRELGSKIANFVKQKSKRIAKETALGLYLEKIDGSFRGYEQDLRDAIQDVQLALSVYRLRLDAENALYEALRQPGTAEKIGKVHVSADSEDTKKLKVDELPSYEDIAKKQTEAKNSDVLREIGVDAVRRTREQLRAQQRKQKTRRRK